MQFSPLLLIVVAFFGASQADPMQVCWRNSYDRGVGTIPNYCPKGSEMNGALCYPLCQANYKGVGPVCWENCPPGFTDIGALCTIPVDIYFPCPWYDICGLTFAKGCCSPCKCKPGYHDDGCSCRRPTQTYDKKSYGRGAGNLPQCTPPHVEDAGLCYDACKTDYTGVGPVCWQNNDGDPNHKIECNPVTFGKTQEDCDQLNAYLKKAGITSIMCLRALVASIIAGHPVGPQECIDLIKNVLPTLIKTPVCA